MLETAAETKAAKSNCPSIAILITPDFSHNNPDIEPNMRGTESIIAPCSKPVNGMNFPAATQHKNARMLPNPNKKLPNERFFFFLKRRYAIATPNKAISKKINAPLFEAIFHSLINFHSSPRTNPKVISSVLLDFR